MDDLDRKIAEKIEPLHSLPDTDTCDYAGMEAFDSKCWIATYRLSPVTLMHVPAWEPRNMEDPDMTVMLIQRLLNSTDYECLIGQDEIEMSWRPSAVKTGQSFTVSLIKNTLAKGVKLAFAKAHGLTE